MIVRREILATLPLFLGLNKTELNAISKSVQIRLRHHKKNSIIAEEGTLCNDLMLIYSGWVESDTQNASRAYLFKEITEAPQMLEPDKMFGINTRYTSTYRAVTACDSILVSKEYLMQLIEQHFIIRLNMLNSICRNTQLYEGKLWKATAPDTEQLIIQFIKQHSRYPAGRKLLFITMNQLATEINDNRLNVSNALKSLADKEQIILRRGIVEVPALQLL